MDSLLELDIELVGDHFRDAIYVAVGHVHGTADVLDCRPGGHAAEGDDLRHVFPAVLTRHVIDYLATTIHTEVNVDVRHRDAFRIEKSLEDQLML